MVRPEISDDDKVIETWQIMTDSTVWVWQFDRREDRYKAQRIGGRSGSKRLHITRDDRKFNQEQVVDELIHMDPFTNGMLRIIDTASRDASLDVRYHLTQDELLELLQVKDEAQFKQEIDAITSELILRRLYALAEKDGSMWQLEYIREVIEARYKAGGTQRTVREMLEAGDRLTTAI